METHPQPLPVLALLLAGLVHLLAGAATAAAGDVPPVRVLAADGQPADLFGAAVDLSGGTLAVGAPRATGPNSADDGAVYVYVRSGSAWVEQARLTPPPGTPVDTLFRFGTRIALEGDTLAVSFPGDDDLGPDSGSVSVFVRSGTSWSLQQRLVASDGRQADRFGAALALSGDRLVAGAPGQDDNGNSAGAAYVFARSGTSWTQEAKLLAGDGEADDGFGSAVDLEGDRAIVGAPFEDSVGNASGSVYVFERAGTSWAQAAQVFAVGPGTPGARFGTAVAVSGDRLAGGGPNFWAPPIFGGVWIFERGGDGAWSHTARLVAAEPSSGRMGEALDFEGDTLLVGAPGQSWGTDWQTGAAWAFRARGGSWTQAALILGDPVGDDDLFGQAVALDGELIAVGAPQLSLASPYGPGFVDVGLIPTGEPPLAVAEQETLYAPDGETGDQYGVSVAVDGATMVIGADGDFGDNRGSVYVHERDAGAWVFRAKLVQSDVPPGASHFGRAVAVDGDTILVGAPLNSNVNGTRAGAAYVFVRSGTDWVEQQKLLAVDPLAQTNDHFGSAVAIDGDTLVVGADLGEGASGNAGTMYVFARSGTVWTQQAKLFGPTFYTAGYAVAVDVDGDTAVAGAWAHREGSVYTGAAFVYRRSGTTWSEEAFLLGSDPLPDGEFGRGVALEGDTLVVGAPRQRTDALDHGTAYVFERSGTTWTETAALRPEGPAFSLRGRGGFGARVALSRGRLAVLADEVSDTQRLFVYARSGSSWTEAGRFVPTTPLQPTTLLPFSMALDGATLALGAPLVDDAASDAGAVYLWDALLVPFVPFCTATPNSTGLPAHIDVSGSNSVAANDLVFTVTDMPPGQSGLVIYSPDQASLPLGNGILCLGNQTQGFVNRLPPTASDAAGVLVHALDVTAPPTPLSQILPGSTWSFSGWFRDVPAGGAGFDFSDGVQVTFAP